MGISSEKCAGWFSKRLGARLRRRPLSLPFSFLMFGSFAFPRLVSASDSVWFFLVKFFVQNRIKQFENPDLPSLFVCLFSCWDDWEKSRASWKRRACRGNFLQRTAVPKYSGVVSTQSGHHSPKKTKGMPSFRKPNDVAQHNPLLNVSLGQFERAHAKKLPRELKLKRPYFQP